MYVTENLLFATLLVLALVPLIVALSRRSRWRVHVLGIAFLAIALVASVVQRPADDAELTSALPTANRGDGLRGSDSCKGCHPGEYASWYGSFHRTMTQVAGPESVVAPFDGRKLEGRGRAFVVDRLGDEFRVTEVLPGSRSREIHASPAARVVMTTGSRHQQIYWTADGQGGLLQFPWVWEIAEAKWIPSEDSFLRPHEWEQTETTWNRDCIRCHSSGPLPGFDRETQQWETRATELGIACAACHGPAEEHIRVNHNPLRRQLYRATDRPDPTIVNARRLTKERSAEVCGQCHSFATFYGSFFEDDWTAFRAGKPMRDHFELYMGAEHQDAYWPDGTSRIGGREYNAMILSGCYVDGEMTCLSCHQMHGDDPRDQLAPSMDGDAACLQCHSDYRERIAEHTFHRAESSGSRCYNCHMPYTSYALLGAARAHRVDSPTASGSGTTDRPNACNLCHLDETLAWTAEHLETWYGIPAPELGDEHREVAGGVLWALRGDAGQRSIAAWHMGRPWALEASGSGWVEPYLGRLLIDPYSAVRLIAQRSLRSFDGTDALGYDHLGDPQARSAASRAVMRRWSEAAGSSGAPATLVDPAGGLRIDRFEQLYEQRNNRQLILTE